MLVTKPGEIIEFKDLAWEEHWRQKGGKIAQVMFPNGWGISVIGGGIRQYGDGKTTFEAAILVKDEGKESWSIYDGDVRGWLPLEELEELIKELQERPAETK